MNKILILNILGKKDFVDLGDQIYDLRDITESLRKIIILNLEIKDEFVTVTSNRLNNIYSILKPIKSRLEKADHAGNYTNSKKYLLRFINNLCINIDGVINNINPINIKELTRYSNMLIDLLLIY